MLFNFRKKLYCKYTNHKVHHLLSQRTLLQLEPTVSYPSRCATESCNDSFIKCNLTLFFFTSLWLQGKNNAVVLTPSCDEKARMVDSRRYKERPHLFTPGKQKGKYRCEKGCLHFNGIRMCSHTIVTAQQNRELLDFLNYYKHSCSKRGINLSLTVQTDMPKESVQKEQRPFHNQKIKPQVKGKQ